MTCSANLSRFVDLLSTESETLRFVLQYKAFKKACIDAESSDDTVSTSHIDWSDNSHIRQAKEENAAYYHEDNTSLHAMCAYEYDGKRSIISLSDDTNHGAPAVNTSLKPILEEFAQKSKTINIIRDSSLSQYRYKSVFWFMQEVVKEHSLQFNWIFLEAGHGKGMPDGIGATGKNAIKDIVACNPDILSYDVDNLLQNKLAEMIPSMLLHHTTDDINLVTKTIPIILHEVRPCGTFKLISGVSESKLFIVQKISKPTGLSMKSNSILFNTTSIIKHIPRPLWNTGESMEVIY